MKCTRVSSEELVKCEKSVQTRPSRFTYGVYALVFSTRHHKRIRRRPICYDYPRARYTHRTYGRSVAVWGPHARQLAPHKTTPRALRTVSTRLTHRAHTNGGGAHTSIRPAHTTKACAHRRIHHPRSRSSPGCVRAHNMTCCACRLPCACPSRSPSPPPGQPPAGLTSS